ncbi:L-ascorbate metabolism protein UlaG (beta-lactamase superfamily) [Paenibacillus shirakamiensis]|uniref:UPF0173 metal-dependent hydrolase J2Z69_001944 n=1 Tax=Paenibacillus shirakamiensis TaxID=1265935 RepID=A0ABS4JGQ3_9BACL|nr:metal-dependent hydrolase [Paenibacillus shirakamiensis]MBP2000901.1 L-ascorbate metabolism protein UlaG (beta-lactamase superfamily) [Paenibacillus shirakamiensis]
MKLTFLGHSATYLEMGDTRIIIDPYLTGNPAAATNGEHLDVDYIFLTHGHGDHVGDAEQIARRTGATIVAIVELANYYEAKGIKTIGMNLGGSYTFTFGTLKFTPALHSSSLNIDGNNLYLGVAAGIVLKLEHFTLYHAGDTALFSDLKLVGMHTPIDLALIPIGDHFTMGPEDALIAAEWIGAKHVIPIHYNTFPVIEQDGKDYVEKLAPLGIQGHALAPGDVLDLDLIKSSSR